MTDTAQPRVLILCEYPTLNGGEHSLLSTLDELQKSFDVQVAAPSMGPLWETLQKNSGIQPIPFDLPAQQFSLADRRKKLSHLISYVQPALVHANSLSMSRLSGPVCAALEQPSLGHLRDMIKVNQTILADLTTHRRLIAVSAATRDWYQSLGIPENSIHVLHNGVDLERFQPQPAEGYLHRELGLAAETPLIGAIGQIGMRKGLDHLLKAVREMENREAHVVIVGERYSQKPEAVQYEEGLHAFSERELPGRVHFLGRRQDVDRLLRELTILAHFARQEPLGRVLLEGAASGCCIVASDVGGTVEIFPPESDSAVLFKADRFDEATCSLQELLSSPTRRQELEKSARRRAIEAFDRHAAAGRLMHHYNAILS